jgi:hypothetical protein
MIDSKIQSGKDTNGKEWFRYDEEGTKHYYLPTSAKSRRDAYSKAKLEGIGIEVKNGVWNGR